jgi:acetoin utilization deacetylase AcuC-like enzyme
LRLRRRAARATLTARWDTHLATFTPDNGTGVVGTPIRGKACYSYVMLTFASDAHRQHHPRQPFHDRDGLTFPPEVPERAERIRAAIDAAGFTVEPPTTHGLGPVLRVHTHAYVDFLEHAHARWREMMNAPADGEAVPYARAIRGQPLAGGAQSVIADLGWYSHDNDALLAGSWAAAVGAVDVTLSAWEAVATGRANAAYALARPPGHHAAADSYAGYCFLNNAAIAAQAWTDRGARVAILDVDYHHGNGTQQIFYERDDVFFASLHADPIDEYPFFLGHASERGSGAGAGFTRNFPLPLGTAWDAYDPALDAAANAINDFGPDALVVSLGVDTAAEDADTFQLVGGDFTRIGSAIGGLALPTLLVQEGGYDLSVLGRNVVNVLLGIDDA